MPRTRPPYFSRMVACCRFSLHVITIIYWMSSMLGTRNTYFSATFKDKPRHLYAFVINCLYHTSIVSRPLGQKGLKGQCYHPSALESHRQRPQRTHGSNSSFVSLVLLWHKDLHVVSTIVLLSLHLPRDPITSFIYITNRTLTNGSQTTPNQSIPTNPSSQKMIPRCLPP